MTIVHVRYDDWLALLIAFRRKLDLKTGDELEIVLTNEGILLRRASQAAGSLARDFASVPSRAEEPVPSKPTAMPAARPGDPLPAAKRKPGRPRKRELEPVAAPKRPRGRPRKAGSDPQHTATATMTPERKEPWVGSRSPGRGQRGKNIEASREPALVDVEPWGIFENLWGEAAASDSGEPEQDALEPPVAAAAVREKRKPGRPRKVQVAEQPEPAAETTRSAGQGSVPTRARTGTPGVPRSGADWAKVFRRM